MTAQEDPLFADPWVRIASIIAVFVVVNIGIGFLAAPDSPYVNGADAGSWLGPAQALLEHGAFVDPSNPAAPQTFRPPLYLLFLAGLLWLGDGSFLPIIVAQLTLLLATGWFARAITEDWVPGYGELAFALVVLNPSAIGSAHLIQSDTLYACLVTATLWIVLRFARSPEPRYVLAAGVVFALACLVRTTGQFLFYVWPVLFPLLAASAGAGRDWRRYLAAGGISLVLALAVVAPWMAHNYSAGEGFSLSTSRLKSAFLWDNIAYLEKYDRGIGLAEAEAIGARQRQGVAVAFGERWPELSARERYGRLVSHGATIFLSYPPGSFAAAFAWAWTQFFAIPGVSNLASILGSTSETPFQVFKSLGSDNYLVAGLEALRRAHPAVKLLTVLGFAYVLALRGFGLAGLGVMLARRHWAPFLVVTSAIAYFALIHLFVANSRYRLPIEPVLILLAIYGLDGFRRRKVRSDTKKRGR